MNRRKIYLPKFEKLQLSFLRILDYFYIYIYIYIYMYSTPPHEQDMTQGQASFLTSCYTKLKTFCMSNYFNLGDESLIEYIPFPNVLVLCEMPTASSRIWTWVDVSSSHEDNYYIIYIYICEEVFWVIYRYIYIFVCVCVCVCLSVCLCYLRVFLSLIAYVSVYWLSLQNHLYPW